MLAIETLAADAVRYSEEFGAPVFPLRRDKTPCTAHGFKDAVLGEDAIYALFKQHPDAALIGLATGGNARLVVVDIDRKNGKDGFCWPGLEGLPHTLTFQTPSGGQHRYYRLPVGHTMRCSVGIVFDGIDIRADGGYVAQGAPYKRIIDEPIATLSEAEVALLSRPRPIAERIADLSCLATSDAAKRVRDIAPGAWHDNVRDTVAHLVSKGVADDMIQSLMAGFTTAGFTEADTRREVQTMIDGARRKGFAPDHEMVSSRFRALSLSELSDLSPPHWLVDGLLMQETDAVVYGESEVGKSFTAISLSVAIASGRPWFGREVKQGGVLYIAGEGGRSLFRRFEAAIDKLGIARPDNIEVISDNADMFKDEDPAALIELVRGRSLQLIVFDTMSQHSGGSTENSDDMKVVLKNMRSVARSCGAANLILAHPGKDTGRGIRGWSGQLNNVDTVIEQVREDNEALGRRTVTLTCKKQKDADKFVPIHLDLDDHSGSLVLLEAGAPVAPKRAKLSGNTLLAYRALCEVIARSGADSVTEEEWRLEAAHRGLGGASERNSQGKAFHRAYNKLIHTHIDVRAGRVSLRDKNLLSGV